MSDMRARLVELADGMERSAKSLWRDASNPDHSWDPATCVKVAQRMSLAAQECRAMLATIAKV